MKAHSLQKSRNCHHLLFHSFFSSFHPPPLPPFFFSFLLHHLIFITGAIIWGPLPTIKRASVYWKKSTDFFSKDQVYTPTSFGLLPLKGWESWVMAIILWFSFLCACLLCPHLLAQNRRVHGVSAGQFCGRPSSQTDTIKRESKTRKIPCDENAGFTRLTLACHTAA